MKEVESGRLFEYSEVKNMGKAFSRYLEDIGLSKKGYTLRTFRKDFISRSQEAGIPISVTASLVGHSNIKTTMTYYTKLSSKHLKDELSKLK
jgi:integrase